MPGKVGSLSWSRSTGGRLSWSDHAQLARMGAAATLQLLNDRLKSRLGLTRRLERGDFEPPHVAWAFDLCRQLSPDWLVNHCFRSYAFGALLAERDGLKFDRELLAIACLLHDLGLVAAHAPTESKPCFAVSGGLAAHALCLEHLSPEQADRVAEAITLHLNPLVPRADGLEAHLLRQGSACDVIGARLSQLERPLRARVLERYPRLGLKAPLARALEGARLPRTRTDFLCRAGFAEMIRRAPFPE